MIALAGEWAYTIAAWVVSAGTIGGYAVATLRRGRRLSREVPPESRRWM